MSLDPRTLSWAMLALACFVSVCAGAHPAPSDADGRAIARLIKELGSSDFERRQRAADALEEMGKAALPALRDASGKDGDPEARATASKIVVSIEAVWARGDAFADEIMQVTEIVSNKYVVEIDQRQLAIWALRGLYEECKQKPNADLESRLSKPTADLQAILRDGRIALKNRKEIEGTKDVEVGIARIFGHLDPYSRYSERDIGCAFPNPSWSNVGLKLRVDPETQMLRIVTPLRDGPAHKADARAGDLITEIVLLANEPDRQGQFLTKGMSVEEGTRKLGGKVGSIVHIVVQRAGHEKPVEIAMERGRTIAESVLGSRRKADASWEYLLDHDAKIAYLRLTAFSEGTTRDLAQALKQMNREGVKGLVFDLRGNPGGFIRASVEMANLFLDHGRVVSIKPRFGPEDKIELERAGDCLHLPLVCLVNGQTASGAELVAANLQDRKRATIIGDRTKGKGSVQNILPVGTDKELILTTAIFLRASGKKWDKVNIKGHDEDEWGVKPDKVVKLGAEEEASLAEWFQQSEAIGAPKEPKPFKDRQLELALESLREQIKKR